MSKNVKRFISTLLAAGILLGSVSAVFADTTETTTADTATATAETAATAAPAAETAATAAPAVTATAAPAAAETAATDSYYEEAIGLLTKMGIFAGYEDGSIKPESTITRAEMAAVILRVMGIEQMSTYAGIFTDVDASHWAASVIQTAANMNIIAGMGDGTFAPDSPVTYEQAVKMVVCAVGYDNLAKGLGGYPTGYIAVAARKDVEVTKNTPGVVGEQATRGTVAKLVYNALNALYPTPSGSDASGVTYATSDDVTVSSKLHNVFCEEGVLTATYSTSIDPSITLSKGQIAIDDIVFNRSEVADMEKYVGYKIKVYYTEYNNDGDKTIIYVVPNRKNDTLTIDADDIDSITNIKSADAVIEYRYTDNSSKTKKAKLSSPTIIYNGKKLYAKDIDTDESMEDFITPEVGELVLNDYDGDGKYDVLFVNKYETIVATSATEKAVMGKYNKPAKVDLNNEDDDKLITIVKDGKEIATKSVKKWDVLTMQRSVNSVGDKVYNIEVCNDTIEGKITDLDEDEDDVKVTIDGKTYEVDSNLFASGDVKIKKEGKFYLDKFGRIAGMESATGGKLSGSEQYGWLIKISYSNDEDGVYAKMFTQGGEVKTYYFATDGVDFWGPEDDDEEITLDLDADEDNARNVLVAADAYANATMAGGLPMKLVKFSLNSKNKIKSLVMPYVTSDFANADEDRVVVHNANMTSAAGMGNMLGKLFALEDGIVEFSVPNSIDDLTDTGTYKVATMPASTYINYDDGVGFDYVVAEFDDTTPAVAIRYIGSSTAPNDFTYNTADDASLFMISKIQTVYDDTEEEKVYKITGYANGNKVEYTTTKTTSVSEAVGISGGVYVNGATGYTGDNSRYYGVTPIWTAANEMTYYNGSPLISEANQEKYEKLTDALKVGDIVGISASGLKANIIIKLVSTKDYVADRTGNPWGKMAQYSSTRDGLAFGAIKEIDTDSNVVFKTSKDEKYSYDPGYYVITYNAKTGKVEDDVTAADLQPYDSEENEGDMVFLRIFKNGQREVFAIRFE